MLADWLFTTKPAAGFGENTFGFKLFGRTWVVYDNPTRRATFGPGAVAPVSFELHFTDGSRATHAGGWLPDQHALALREGQLRSLVVRLE